MTKRLVLPLAILLSPAAALADVLIPSTVFRDGAGGAKFQSDVRIFNATTAPVLFTPVFYDQTTGSVVEKAQVTVPPRQQLAYDNVLSSLFGLAGGASGPFGPVRLRTSAAPGSLIASSSVNNTNGCGNGSVSGQWLPGLDATAALTKGTLVQLAASGSSSAGYRTNVAFTNPADQTATVTARVRKGDGTLLATAVLTVDGNGFRQVGLNEDTFNGIGSTTDTNLWLEVASDRAVLAFASVISNTSGDPYAIVMTPDPSTAVAPAVDFSFAPAAPQTAQSVTFTDTSTGLPPSGVTHTWAFGDGSTAISGATASHTYATAGTFKAAHFVTTPDGTGVKSKDVIVTAPVTKQELTIVARQFAFEPKDVTLLVGTTYKLTFTSADVIHGIGGLSALGIINCEVVSITRPCVVDNFKPTASQIKKYPYSCSQTACGSGHSSMTGSITVANP